MSQPAEVIESPQAPFPQFEGHPVKGVSVKITGLSTVNNQQIPPFGVDDRLRLVGEFKCVGVRHFVDKNGEMIREHVVIPVELETCPWDPTDPFDDGILRAKAQP